MQKTQMKIPSFLFVPRRGMKLYICFSLAAEKLAGGQPWNLHVETIAVNGEVELGANAI